MPGFFGEGAALGAANYVQGQQDTQVFNANMQAKQLALQQAQEEAKHADFDRFDRDYAVHTWDPASHQFFIQKVREKFPLGGPPPKYDDLVGLYAELGKSKPGAMIPEVPGKPEVKGQVFVAPKPAVDNSIDMGVSTPAVAGQPAIAAQAAVPGVPAHQGPETPGWTPDTTSDTKAETIEANKERAGAMQEYYKLAAGAKDIAQPNLDASVNRINATLAKYGIAVPPLTAAAGVMGTEKIKESESKINLNLAKIGFTEEQIKYIPLKFKQMSEHYTRMADAIDRRNDISEEQKNIERAKLNETMTQDAFNRAQKGQTTPADYNKLLSLKASFYKADAHGRVHPPPKEVEGAVDAAIAGYEAKKPQGGGQSEKPSIAGLIATMKAAGKSPAVIAKAVRIARQNGMQ